MSTLYRKYRPQIFSDVFGQAHIKQTLQNELLYNKSAHAYLFCGPRGVGKTTVARLLAKSLNCENRLETEYEPCNSCSSCLDIIANRSLDVIEIDAASHTGVEHVREHIINAARFIPQRQKYKVFIIDEVHMLSTQAFNALLKILEEPPAYIKFILATTEIHKILPTIISRCQRFDFKKIDAIALRERLSNLVASEGKSIDPEVYPLIIKNSDGCLRDAESLLGQLLILGDTHISLQQVELVLPVTHFTLCEKLLEFLISKDIRSSLMLIQSMLDDGVHLEYFTRDFIEYLRSVLLYVIHGNDEELSISEKTKVLAKSVSIKEVSEYIESFLKALNGVKNSHIIQLPLELAVISLVGEKADTRISQVSMEPSKTISTSIQFNSVLKEDKKNNEIVDEKSVSVTSSSTLEAPTQTSVSSDNFKLNDVLLRWDYYKQAIQGVNYGLSCVISAAVPRSLEDNGLLLACKHKFNVDKIEDIKNKIILEDSFLKTYGIPLRIRAIQDATVEARASSSDSVMLGDVLKKGRLQKESVQNQNDEKVTTSTNKNEMDSLLDLFGGTLVG